MTNKKKFIWEDLEEELENEKPKKEIEEEIFKSDIEDEEEFEDIPNENKKNKLKTPRFFNRFSFTLIFAISILLLCFGVLFLPIFALENIVINETNFITTNEIEEMLNFETGERYSYYNLSQSKKNVNDNTISSSETNYIAKENTLYVEVIEIKPLAINEEGEFYYEDDGEIYTSTSFYLSAPKLYGFSEEKEYEIVNELKELEYDIIKEISAIQYLDDPNHQDLVIMEMKDGNYVQINIFQISDKMPYYLQMNEIIKLEADGKNGIIYLDIGDYYEPIE